MPIITFTPADKMLATTVEASYQPAIVADVDGPKASGSGKSINWFLTFRLEGGKYSGKEIKVAFSSGSNNPSVLGDLAWMPTAFMRQVYAAVKDIPVADVPDSFDTDEMKGGKLDVKVEVNTGDGTGLFNTISQFLPAGKSATATKSPF